MVTRKGDSHVFSILCRGAQQVYLVGDFNNWSTTSTAMRPAGNGMWQVDLRLPAGTYRFGYFVIHSHWFNDESSLGILETDGSGPTSIKTDNWNSTISVPGN